MRVLRLPGLAAFFLGALLARSATAPANFGQIKAEQVIGEVDAVDTDKTVTPLHNDDLLYQGFTIRTAAESSIVLVFSNGATVRLAPNTELAIEEFLHDPFAEAELSLAKLDHEPMTSSTRLRLAKGEIVGHVLPLHAGSTHVIATPVGAAGIRGTTFRHVVQVNPNGNTLFTSATDEGAVAFTALDGQTATIGAGTEITGHRRLGRRGGLDFAGHDISRRSKVVIDHHQRIMRAIRARVRFRREDVRPANAPRPALRRDPAAQRSTDNDFKDIDREEQDKIRQEQSARPAKAAAPKAKKK